MTRKTRDIILIIIIAVCSLLAIGFIRETSTQLSELEKTILHLEHQIEAQHEASVKAETQISALRSAINKLKFQPVTVANNIIKEVRLRRLVLVDENNREQYILEQNGNSPTQKFIGKNGQTRIQIGLVGNGSSELGLFDDNGNPTVKISGSGNTGNNVRSSVALFTEKSTPAVVLNDSKESSGLWILNPETNLPSLSAQRNQNRFFGIASYDNKGKPVTILGEHGGVFNGLQIFDKNGMLRSSSLVLHKDNAAYLEQYSSQQEIRFSVRSGSSEEFTSFAYQSGGTKIWEGLSDLSTFLSLKNLFK